jgi:hypothetical protein
MVHASVRAWRPGKGLSVVVGVLLLGAVAIALTPSGPAGAAQAKDSKETPKETPDKKGPAVPPPAPFTHVLHKDSKNDVAEMVKTINDKVEADWAKNKVTPSRWVDDYEFIRRASLDIIGRIARPEEIREFQKDPEHTRRSLLIDRLLGSEDYARHWANMWTNWMLTRSGAFGRGMYHEQMTVWLEDQFAQNKPYHEIVRSVLRAEGENTKNGAVNFMLAHVGENVPPKDRGDLGQFEMVPLTSRITRLFLGTQVQCAQCHDHPFQSAIKQQHFWGINAFLRQIERKGNLAMNRQDTPGPLTLADNEGVCKDAEVFFEKRNGVILTRKAEFLPSNGEEKGRQLDPSKTGVKRREELASFLIDHDMFPKAIVNRMWGVFFGRGFVNPIDDFNDNNQPSNPELLTEVSARFKHYNYDLKKLIRWVCNSKPYHLSCVANKTNDKQEQEVLFSRMVLKAMSPEQLFESLMVATRAEAAESKDGKKAARDAWLGSLISNFGDDEGNEVNFNGTVVQALMMMNGKEINDAISRKEKGTVAMAVSQARVPQTVVTELYLAALNRPPTAKEMSMINQQFNLRPQFQQKDLKEPSARFEDLFWALLNSNEFMLNH